MLGTASTVGREYLGRNLTVKATGEHARGRLVFHAPSPDAGKIEVGLADGTTRLVTVEEVERATDYPVEMRAIPVSPDAADGSSREMGVCENEGCGITANVITFVTDKNAKWHCGAHRVRHGGDWVPAATKTFCTHCYAAQGRG
ncbi:hypothetical protein ACH427_04465 [Streptomyces sp. NPDC020379]|uniref:hypothetical protein n=1 Tax=Streptomyces sp. NPDC020379 TaxID=3365071 RepID=UPI0037A45631